jgi:hypothetical protein
MEHGFMNGTKKRAAEHLGCMGAGIAESSIERSLGNQYDVT